MILDEIVENKRREVEAQKRRVPRRELEQRLGRAAVPRNFLEALDRSKSRPAFICECKHASPSRGVIRDPYNPVAIARAYAANGAAAISVLTDEKYFGGTLDHLETVHQAVPIPVLRKDFIVDDYQILEARAAGADAVLLIAAILDAALMRDLIEVIWAMRMHALVEVHDAGEIERAAESNTGIIGINNRDLRTLEVDLGQTERLLPHLPEGILAVSESGIHSRDDVAHLRDLGVGAVLIGERLMAAEDPGRALVELMDVR